jgi:hypothetical protein
MASGFIVVCRDSPPVCILDLLCSIRSSSFDPLAGVWGVHVCTTVNDASWRWQKELEKERERVETRSLLLPSRRQLPSYCRHRRKKNLFDSAGVAAVSIKKKRETDSKRKGVKQICECNLFQEKRGQRREYRKSPW